jgi:hypothetical protein
MVEVERLLRRIKRGYPQPVLGDALLDTPQAKIEKPILIESAILRETLYLVANEAQAREIENAGSLCYLPGEIRTLIRLSAGMDEESWKVCLGKIHEVKKIFRGSKIDVGLG